MNAAVAVLAALLVLAGGCARTVAPLPEAPLAAPTPAPPVALPRDAGPHDALTEWWYFTGHLRSDRDGRRYGFEFTIFQARREAAPTGYLAHFAISDLAGQRFSHQSRVAQGEAARGFPLAVDGWRLESDGAADLIHAAMRAGPGADPPFSLSARLIDQKPPALHHGGYIEVGAGGGSYYYSRTRLAVTGELGQGDAAPERVSGEAWMDHQWGNFVVSSVGGGWDWYSLQLDDRTELMLYVLRTADGRLGGLYGTQVLADGRVVDLAPGSVSAEAVGAWTSPHTNATYPSGWRLRLPGGEQLDVRPALADQELFFPGQEADVGTPGAVLGAPAYWEGAVTVTGDRTGVGYVELTGYAGR